MNALVPYALGRLQRLNNENPIQVCQFNSFMK